MNFWIAIVLSLSILLPAVMACIRFSKINRVYYPFIYCIWLGALSEIVGDVMIICKYSNTVQANIYVLIESLLFAWQFIKWKLFERKKILFGVIVIIILCTWVWENFVFSKITYVGSYFRIVYSFFIVVMGISIINRLIVTERKNLLKNSVFLICVAFVFYYTLKILVESFWVYGINDTAFSLKLYVISIIANLIANLIYTVAILWMPTKQRFTLPSS